MWVVVTEKTILNSPIVPNMPNLDVTKCSTSEEITIFTIGCHGQNTVTNFMYGIKFRYIATALMVGIYLYNTSIQCYENAT